MALFNNNKKQPEVKNYMQVYIEVPARLLWVQVTVIAQDVW